MIGTEQSYLQKPKRTSSCRQAQEKQNGPVREEMGDTAENQKENGDLRRGENRCAKPS